MSKNFLRSPFLPMGTLVLVIGSLLLILTNTPGVLTELYWVIMVLVVFLWPLLIKSHNRNNPNDQIKIGGFLPTEFREMDEGQQWVTYRACRNVYIYYNVALPLTAVIFFSLAGNKFAPLICLGLLGIGQYLVYWLTINRFLKQD